MAWTTNPKCCRTVNVLRGLNGEIVDTGFEGRDCWYGRSSSISGSVLLSFFFFLLRFWLLYLVLILVRIWVVYCSLPNILPIYILVRYNFLSILHSGKINYSLCQTPKHYAIRTNCIHFIHFLGLSILWGNCCIKFEIKLYIYHW